MVFFPSLDQATNASIFDLDQFKIPEQSTARRLLESGLLNFDKKMICLEAFNSSRGMDKALGSVLKAFKIEFKDVPLIQKNGTPIFEPSDLIEAKKMLKEAEEKGITCIYDFPSNQNKIKSAFFMQKISKEEFNEMMEEEQLKYLDSVDKQNELDSIESRRMDNLSKQLIEFWEMRVNFLEKNT